MPKASATPLRHSMTPGVKSKAKHAEQSTASSLRKRWPFPVEKKEIRRGPDGSLGMSIKTRDGTCGQLTVHSVQPFGPAQRIGIRRGHVIVALGGQDILGYSHQAAVNLLAQLGKDSVIPLTICLSSVFTKYQRSRGYKEPEEDESVTPTETSQAEVSHNSAARRLEYSPLKDIRPEVEEVNPLKQQVDELLTFLAHLRDNKGLTRVGEDLLEEYGFAALLENHAAQLTSQAITEQESSSTSKSSPTAKAVLDYDVPLGGKSLREVVLGGLMAHEVTEPEPTAKPQKRSPSKSTKTKTKATKPLSAAARLSSAATESSRQKMVQQAKAPAKREDRSTAPKRTGKKKVKKSKLKPTEPASWNFMTPDEDTTSIGPGITRGSDHGSDFSFVNLARLDHQEESLTYHYENQNQNTHLGLGPQYAENVFGESFRSRASAFV